MTKDKKRVDDATVADMLDKELSEMETTIKDLQSRANDPTTYDKVLNLKDRTRYARRLLKLHWGGTVGALALMALMDGACNDAGSVSGIGYYPDIYEWAASLTHKAILWITSVM